MLCRSSSRWLALVACFLFLVVHASVMPIQYDEAVTVLSLAEHGPLSAFTRYTDGTNNHLLLSIVVGILLRLGATHVFLLRLPSLLAAAAFLLGVDRLSRPLDPRLRLLLPFAVVAVPLFHDYLVMARGYALGIAFLLYGWLAERPNRTGVLYGLAICCVPTFVLDVVILWMTRGNWKTAAFAFLPPLAAYGFVLPDVVRASLTAVGDGSSVEAFIRALHGIPTGGWAVAAVAAASLWKVRREKTLSLPAALSVPILFIGYPRTHLLTALLLLLTIFYSLPRKTVMAAIVFLTCAASLLTLPQDRIASEPNTWPVTGYSVARELTPCLSVQRRGAFAAPADYYAKVTGEGEPLRDDCPHFLMVTQPSLKIPSWLRLYPEILSPYRVEMYRRSDLDSLLRNLKKQGGILVETRR